MSMKNLKCLILLASFVVVIRANSSNTVVNVDPECAKGAAFWCRDIVNAKKCNAVNFCISAVWESHFSVDDSDSVCDGCKSFVSDARELFKKEVAHTYLFIKLKANCGSIPASDLASNCMMIIDRSKTEIVRMLESKMDPSAFCSALMFCNNAEYDKALESPKSQPSIGIHKVSVDSAVQLNSQPVQEKPTCPFCLMALQEVTDLIKSNKSKASIESALSKLCNHLNEKLMSQCTEFVKDYTNQVVDMLLADFTPQDACTFIKLCSEKSPELRNVKIVGVADFDDSKNREVLANPQCDLCKAIVQIVEQGMINNNTKDEIRQELEHSCERLKKFSAKCKAFVDQFSDRIVDLIEKEMEPEEVCRNFMFCVAADDAESQDYDSGLEVFGLAVNEPAVEIKEQPTCVICEFVMSKLEEEINDSKTDEEIKNAVRNVCSKMPKTIGKTCNQFVDYYFDMVIALLKTMKPAMVCSEMKLCTSNNLDDLALVKKIHNDVFTCAVCKGIVTGLDAIVEDPTVDTKIEEFEEKFCETVSGKYKEKCHNLTQTYGEAIVKLLQTITESDQICYKLNLCAMESFTGMVQMTE